MSPHNRTGTSGSFRRAVSSFASAFAGAGACAAAVENGRRPSDRALAAVGIDGVTWDRIGRS